jgi:zinc transporter ZupT
MLGDGDDTEPGERTRAVSIDKPLPSIPKSGDGGNDSDLDLDELDPITDDMQPLTGRSTTRAGESSEHNHQRPKKQPRQVSFADSPSYHEAEPDTSANEKRAILQCLLLEAGILFHSVFIGMALSVSSGPAFAVLLLAISFHQTFEGLALGTRIAAIKSFSPGSTRPWLMSLMYGITTPIGQAIGLAVHTLYDPASEFGLLMVGIVNGISSGLLLYAGLVQLIAEDFLSDHSYVELQGRRRVQACLAVVAGGLLMALVGAFA